MKIKQVKFIVSDGVNKLPEPEATMFMYFEEQSFERIEKFFEGHQMFAPLKCISISEGEFFDSEADAHKYYLEHWGGPSYHHWPILLLGNDKSNTEKT